MAERIVHLSESPCFKCSRFEQCADKVSRAPCLASVVDYVFPRKGFTYKKCSIYQVLRLEGSNKV